MSAARGTLPIGVFSCSIPATAGGNSMSAIQSGCLRAALLVAAFASTSAAAEISPNGAQWPTGEGWVLRPQGITAVTHDWDIPDSPLRSDAVTPKITIDVPTEFKVDIDLTIHRADPPPAKGGPRVRRARAIALRGVCAPHDVRNLRCRSHPGRHP
jgi:hypothetical protein